MLSMLNSHMYVLKYDDFSLPKRHQKPIFSPLSCGLQASERNSWQICLCNFLLKGLFLLFVSRRLSFCLDLVMKNV